MEEVCSVRTARCRNCFVRKGTVTSEEYLTAFSILRVKKALKRPGKGNCLG